MSSCISPCAPSYMTGYALVARGGRALQHRASRGAVPRAPRPDGPREGRRCSGGAPPAVASRP
eukprot:scaffold102798_cov80-Phaeocystis_antarctica.AAC.1